jgi:hypothetical protein
MGLCDFKLNSVKLKNGGKRRVGKDVTEIGHHPFYTTNPEFAWRG